MNSAPGLVHVRWAEPDVGDEASAHLDRVERARLARLARVDDQARFVTSRALLKSLVGDLAGQPALDIRLAYDCDECGEPHGRPVVVGPAGRQGWQVSLAHAGDRVVVGAAVDLPVGVDVEPVAAVAVSPLAEGALTAAERAELAAAPDADRLRWLARTWVRKEALLKARGIGLRADPGSIETSTPEVDRSMLDLDLGAGYAAAVCLLGADAVSASLTADRGAPRSTATAGTAR